MFSQEKLLKGEKKYYDRKVDVYSFSLVLWEMLTNTTPFKGMSAIVVAYAVSKVWMSYFISNSLFILYVNTRPASKWILNFIWHQILLKIMHIGVFWIQIDLLRFGEDTLPLV